MNSCKSEMLAIVQPVFFFPFFPHIIISILFLAKTIGRVLVSLHFDTSVNTLKYFAKWNSCCLPSPIINTLRFPQSPILPASLEILRLNDELKYTCLQRKVGTYCFKTQFCGEATLEAGKLRIPSESLVLEASSWLAPREFSPVTA